MAGTDGWTKESWKKVRRNRGVLGNRGAAKCREDCRCGRHQGQRHPLDELLVIDRRAGHCGRFKQRLIDEGLLEDRCAGCGIGSEWNGQPIVLQLDHKNGNSRDWLLENLQILCPNCHSQTDTYAGRNKQRGAAQK